MTEHEKQIIEDAIQLNGKGGVKTEVKMVFESNYKPFIRYFQGMEWTQEHNDFAIKKWKEIHCEGASK